MTDRPETARHGKVFAALAAALGAGLILMSNGRVWAHGTVSAPVRLSVDATGSSLTPLPYTLGLAALASAVALFAVRRFGRYAVGVVLLLAGAGTIAAIAAKLGDLNAALGAQAAAHSAVFGVSRVGAVSSDAWPYLALAGALLVALSGGYTLLRGRAWTGLSNRYETAPAQDAAPAGGAKPDATSRDLWDSLNRGADPTV